jgi:hypothetical protein
MKGLLVILGESFRSIHMHKRTRGLDVAYPEQMKALHSHLEFGLDIFFSTYSTKFDDEIKKVYKDRLIGCSILPDPVGYNALLHGAISQVNLENYDFVFFIRIDLYFKEKFFEIFDPTWNTIRFPSICFKFNNYHIDRGGNPRVNDTMIFVPKKYFNHIKYIYYGGDGHDMWTDFIEKGKLTYDDLDVMVNTYHDSDSAKDFNPMYYIVNRPESNVVYSLGEIFDKRQAQGLKRINAFLSM